jgi:O-antigen/teichoic acid export membrane protein
MSAAAPSPQAAGAVLARNTLYNLVGRAVPLVAGLVAIPLLIRELGVDRFGLLMLLWTVINYSTVFDLGLGRATTRFVAHYRSAGRVEELPGLIWTSWTVTFALGSAAGLVLAAVTPLLAESVFHVPDAMRGEAVGAFYLLAAFLPVVLTAASVRGVLEAHQRFDLVNVVQSPGAVANYLAPLFASLITPDLRWVVLALMMVRASALMAFLVLSLRIMPGLRHRPARKASFQTVLKFGGWLTVSGILSPIMEYVDRLLIAGLITLAAVAYYTTPYTMVAQLHLVSGSLIAVLFPAFSGLASTRDLEATALLYRRSVKYVFLLAAPVGFVLMVLASDIMTLWVGAEFAGQSHRVMTILAFGMFVSAMARVPYVMVQAGGRPDITAKFHLLEVVPFVAVSWMAIRTIGVTGAAIAWTVRVAIDAGLLYWYADRMLGLKWAGRLFAARLVVLLAGVYGAAWAGIQVAPSLLGRVAVVGAVLLLAAAIAWRWWLDDAERALLERGRGTLARYIRQVTGR